MPFTAFSFLKAAIEILLSLDFSFINLFGTLIPLHPYGFLDNKRQEAEMSTYQKNTLGHFKRQFTILKQTCNACKMFK